MYDWNLWYSFAFYHIYIYALSLSLSLPLSMIVSRVYFFDVEVLTSAMWLEEGVVFLVGVVNQLARHATLGAAQKKGNDLGGFPWYVPSLCHHLDWLNEK